MSITSKSLVMLMSTRNAAHGATTRITKKHDAERRMRAAAKLVILLALQESKFVRYLPLTLRRNQSPRDVHSASVVNKSCCRLKRS